MSSPGAEGLKTERLFFALWPSDEVRQALRRNCKSLLRHSGGRPVVPENWHITLAFLGGVSKEQRRCAEQVAATIQLPGFDLRLDYIGHWARPRVLWAGARETPDALKDLAASLINGSRACGLSLDARPFVTHLTLKRKVKEASPSTEIKPVIWPVTSFVLVKSHTLPEGVQYRVVREWKLRA